MAPPQQSPSIVDSFFADSLPAVRDAMPRHDDTLPVSSGMGFWEQPVPHEPELCTPVRPDPTFGTFGETDEDELHAKTPTTGDGPAPGHGPAPESESDEVLRARRLSSILSSPHSRFGSRAQSLRIAVELDQFKDGKDCEEETGEQWELPGETPKSLQDPLQHSTWWSIFGPLNFGYVFFLVFIFIICILHIGAEQLGPALPDLTKSDQLIDTMTTVEHIEAVAANRPFTSEKVSISSIIFGSFWALLSLLALCLLILHTFGWRQTVRAWEIRKIYVGKSMRDMPEYLRKVDKQESWEELKHAPVRRRCWCFFSVYYLFKRVLRLLQRGWAKVSYTSGDYFWLRFLVEEMFEIGLQIYSCTQYGGVNLLSLRDNCDRPKLSFIQEIPASHYQSHLSLALLIALHSCATSISVLVVRNRGWAIVTALICSTSYPIHLLAASSTLLVGDISGAFSQGVLVGTRSKGILDFLSAFVPLLASWNGVRVLNGVTFLQNYLRFKLAFKKTLERTKTSHTSIGSGRYSITEAIFQPKLEEGKLPVSFDPFDAEAGKHPSMVRRRSSVITDETGEKAPNDKAGDDKKKRLDGRTKSNDAAAEEKKKKRDTVHTVITLPPRRALSACSVVAEATPRELHETPQDPKSIGKFLLNPKEKDLGRAHSTWRILLAGILALTGVLFGTFNIVQYFRSRSLCPAVKAWETCLFKTRPPFGRATPNGLFDFFPCNCRYIVHKDMSTKEELEEQIELLNEAMRTFSTLQGLVFTSDLAVSRDDLRVTVDPSYVDRHPHLVFARFTTGGGGYPTERSCFPKLESLVLQYQRWPSRTVPDSVCGLKALRQLDVRLNDITNLPPCMTQLDDTLQYLDASLNPVCTPNRLVDESLPEDFREMMRRLDACKSSKFWNGGEAGERSSTCDEKRCRYAFEVFRDFDVNGDKMICWGEPVTDGGRFAGTREQFDALIQQFQSPPYDTCLTIGTVALMLTEFITDCFECPEIDEFRLP
ncbi:unnamed protein product [Vitrella brassicaformis CCMP3155]|uniref:Uncharacterized protein n=2 Tax=Vitrella brassicaformis TaxID=1169539 RepID=A0A0G4ENP3_VITBC|nr:unnamed protein product [Vitrella brassicaformis CCMP3155]|eukprot:CEL99223.1 unnamed protein product [Vitrella brassicaformis CCMP3155]